MRRHLEEEDVSDRLAGKRLVAPVVAAVAVVAFLAIAPTSIGGTATWITTTGTSMEPGIRTGDLVVTRPAGEYRPGDVVAYRSDALHGSVVLHRVVGESPRGLQTRGDANSWTDPDPPRPAQVMGRMWLHVPGGGRVLAHFTNPVVVVLLLLGLAGLAGGGAAAARRRRERGATAPAVTRRSSPSSSPVLPAPLARGKEWATAVAVVSAGVAVFAYAQPLTTPTSSGRELRHTAELDYTAAAQAPGVYAAGVVRTGDPVLLAIAPSIRTSMTYELRADTSDVTGTVRAVARLRATNGWQRAVRLTAAESFSGPSVEHRARVDLAGLRTVVERAERVAGTAFGGVTVDLVHQVEVRGTVDGGVVDDTYRPALSFTLDGTQAVLTTPVTAGAGAPRVVRLADTRSTSATGAEPNLISLLGLDVPVATARLLATVLAVLGGALALLLAGRARGARGSVPRERLVTVTNVDVGGRPVVDVPDLPSVVALAQLHDTALLHTSRPEAELYHVVAGGVLYRYARPQEAGRVAPASVHSAATG